MKKMQTVHTMARPCRLKFAKGPQNLWREALGKKKCRHIWVYPKNNRKTEIGERGLYFTSYKTSRVKLVYYFHMLKDRFHYILRIKIFSFRHQIQSVHKYVRTWFRENVKTCRDLTRQLLTLSVLRDESLWGKHLHVVTERVYLMR